MANILVGYNTNTTVWHEALEIVALTLNMPNNRFTRVSKQLSYLLRHQDDGDYWFRARVVSSPLPDTSPAHAASKEIQPVAGLRHIKELMDSTTLSNTMSSCKDGPVNIYHLIALVLLNSKNRFQFILTDLHHTVRFNPAHAEMADWPEEFEMPMVPNVFIRATQGHSVTVTVDNSELMTKKITKADLKLVHPMIHGTFLLNMKSIMT